MSVKNEIIEMRLGLTWKWLYLYFLNVCAYERIMKGNSPLGSCKHKKLFFDTRIFTRRKWKVKRATILAWPNNLFFFINERTNVHFIIKELNWNHDFLLWDRDVLFEFHLKFWNTASIGIPVRSLGRQTSNWSYCSTKRNNYLMVFK